MGPRLGSGGCPEAGSRDTKAEEVVGNVRGVGAATAVVVGAVLVDALRLEGAGALSATVVPLQ